MKRQIYPIILASAALSLVLGCCIIEGNCGSNNSGSEGSFTITAQYGPPNGPYTNDHAEVYGQVISGNACDPNSDPNNCITQIPSGAYTPYVMWTDDVGGVDWSLGAYGTANCPNGYPSQDFTVDSETEYYLTCNDPVTELTGAPEAWIEDQSPSSITYTGASPVFPSGGYTTVVTVYDTSGNVQAQFDANSTSTTSISFSVPNNVVGTHIVVFRDPSTGAVLGASAYLVAPNPPPPGPCPNPHVKCYPNSPARIDQTT